MILVIFDDEVFPLRGGCEVRQIVIVGSHFSAVERSFEVFHVYLFSPYTATLFLIFLQEEQETVSRATHIECAKMVKFYFGFQKFSLPATSYVPLLL